MLRSAPAFHTFQMFKIYKDPHGASIFSTNPVGNNTASLSSDTDSPEVLKLKLRVKQLTEEVSQVKLIVLIFFLSAKNETRKRY